MVRFFPTGSAALLSSVVLMVMNPAVSESAEAGVSPQPNILMISVDTLCPRMLGVYGYPRDTSPTIDRLAREGVLFPAAYSPSPWTLPSHASLFTGLYPSQHGVISHSQALNPLQTTLASWLASIGYSTAAFVNAHNVGPRYGLDIGFQEFELVPMAIHQAEPTVVEDRARCWLESSPPQPFFLFLHFYDVHSDYRSLESYESRFTEPYRGHIDGTTDQLLSQWRGELEIGVDDLRHLVGLYVAGVRQIDDGIGRILGTLGDVGLDDSTLVVLLSDHGEEFLEHGSTLHGRTQYDEVLHVPLMMRGPGLPQNTVVRSPTALVDVFPTIAGYLGVKPPVHLAGRDMSPLWSSLGHAADDRRCLFGEADHNNEALDMTRSIRCGRYKVILDRLHGSSVLFDVQNDPSELRDLSADLPEVHQKLMNRLRDFMATNAQSEEAVTIEETLSDDERDSLRALGYLVGSLQ